MAHAEKYSSAVAARGLASTGLVRGGSLCGQAASLLVLALTRRGLGALQLVQRCAQVVGPVATMSLLATTSQLVTGFPQAHMPLNTTRQQSDGLYLAWHQRTLQS